MTEPEFDLRDLHPKASPEAVAERQALAERVCRELRHAGLPVHRADLGGGPRSRPGVDVHVTPFIDGGVYVNRSTDAELRDAALDLFAQGIDYANPPPLLRHYNAVLKHMQAALPSMIQVTGFRP
ncbi:UNVERIFIED_CONTAM: hypothetical protein RKD50_003820 [Streptomyces canus]